MAKAKAKKTKKEIAKEAIEEIKETAEEAIEDIVEEVADSVPEGVKVEPTVLITPVKDDADKGNLELLLKEVKEVLPKFDIFGVKISVGFRLTKDLLKDERFMKRFMHGVKIGVIKWH